MRQQLEEIRVAAIAELNAVTDKAELENIRVKYSGKKGALTAILKSMGKLSAEERPVMGQLANEVRAAIEEAYAARAAEVEAAALRARLASETVDVTMPGKVNALGHQHPLTTVINEVRSIFGAMGFETVEGPEVEYDYYNFEALNTPQVILHVTPRIPSTFLPPCFFVPSHPPFRYVSWNTVSPPSVSSLPDVFTAPTQLTLPTPPSSTRLRV